MHAVGLGVTLSIVSIKSKKSIPQPLRGRRLSEIPSREISWLWQARIARQSLTILTGRTSVGKSWVLCDAVTRLSNGRKLDGDPQEQTPVQTAWIGAEDAPDAILRPRLESMGADLSCIHILDVPGDVISLREDLRRIQTYVTENDCGLVILDPLNAFMPRVDTYRDAEIRQVLGPIAQMAEETNAAVVAIVHQNKGAVDEVDGVNGSVAYGAAARCILSVKKPDQDGDRRVLAVLKNNYVAERDKPRPQTFTLDGGFRWRGLSTDDDLNAKEPGRPADQRDKGKELLREWLQYEPLPSTVIEHMAEGYELSMNTMKRAKKELGVQSFQTPEGWFWRLPVLDVVD